MPGEEAAGQRDGRRRPHGGPAQDPGEDDEGQHREPPGHPLHGDPRRHRPGASAHRVELRLRRRRHLVGDVGEDVEEESLRLRLVGVEGQGLERLAHGPHPAGGAVRRRLQALPRRRDVAGREVPPQPHVVLAVEVALHRLGDLARGAGPVLRLHREGAVAQLVELGRHRGHALGRARHLAGGEARQQRRHVPLPAEARQREDLEEDRPQRVHVGPRVDPGAAAGELLGRHVPERAEERALGGDDPRCPDHQTVGLHRPLVVVGLRAGHREILPEHLGEPPVEQIHLAERAQHHVARLQIAVDHAPGVGVVDGQADLGERREQAPRAEALGPGGVALPQVIEHALQRLAADPLHGEVDLLVVADVEVVHRHDGRVLELPLHPRLAQEAAQRPGVAARGAHRLAGHPAADALIEREPHLPHPARAQHRAGLVARRPLDGVELELEGRRVDRLGAHVDGVVEDEGIRGADRGGAPEDALRRGRVGAFGVARRRLAGREGSALGDHRAAGYRAAPRLCAFPARRPPRAAPGPAIPAGVRWAWPALPCCGRSTLPSRRGTRDRRAAPPRARPGRARTPGCPGSGSATRPPGPRPRSP